MKQTKKDLLEEIQFLKEDLENYSNRCLLGESKLTEFISLLENTEYSIKNKKKKINSLTLAKELKQFCMQMRNRISDWSICNNSLKSVYFCNLSKNHVGNHKDEFFEWENK